MKKLVGMFVVFLVLMGIFSLVSAFENNVKYVSGITCEPGVFSCDNSLQNVVVCNQNGDDYNVQKVCNEGCTTDWSVGGTMCVEDAQILRIEKLKSHYNISITINVLLAVALIILIIISLSNKKQNRHNKNEK
ncbi:hypothetical protein COV16_04215 [Candidatus Woesearchaeota archaeon CG10_big_fil_rev_8_21_14_0_10_34_8]|nr:MAG: hypothetical protein COV16_04215 [Candidatus Woesearchaeota archaeon CG10_big_fil_rev_8_21_14_0_10_34_8]